MKQGYSSDFSIRVVAFVLIAACVLFAAYAAITTLDKQEKEITELRDTIGQMASDAKLEESIDLSVFGRFGVVGDSFASGALFGSHGEEAVEKYEVSWPQIMARRLGVTADNYSRSAETTRSWLEDEERGLAFLKSNPAADIYYLVLGINDYSVLGRQYLGSLSDISSHASYADYEDTFYGNYGRIIEQIREYAPHSFQVMFTCADNDGEAASYNAAIEEIASYYGIPCLKQHEDSFFTSDWYRNGMVEDHPQAMVYSGMSRAFERMLKACIAKNYEYFRNAFIY